MKKLLTLLLVLSLSAMVLTACGNPSNTAGASASAASLAEESEDFNASILFNGSSSLSPVMASLASSFTETYGTWDQVDPAFPAEDISIYVASGGSGVGINSVLDGTADFGMVSRTVKDTEKELMEQYQEFVMASDALTVSVNRENPIIDSMTDMSTDTIRDIFSGKLQYWDEVDSSLEHKEIAVYIRDLSGGAYSVFQKAVMGDTEISPNATQSASMGALGSAIAGNPYGIGYASFGVYNQNIDNLFAMQVDGIAPTVETITDGSYIIQRPMLLICNTESLTAPQQAFMDYVFSEAGIDAIEANGYIPVIE